MGVYGKVTHHVHELATGTIPMTKHLPYMTPRIRDEVGDSGHIKKELGNAQKRIDTLKSERKILEKNIKELIKAKEEKDVQLMVIQSARKVCILPFPPLDILFSYY